MPRSSSLVRLVVAAVLLTPVTFVLHDDSLRAACLSSRPLEHLPNFPDGNWLACDDSTGGTWLASRPTPGATAAACWVTGW
jgi:hypothetical protein